MGYRIIVNENVESATIDLLRDLGHDLQWIGEVPARGFGADDREIATCSRESTRLVLTQDDDFFTDLNLSDSYGVLFQTDQTLSSRDVGEIVHEMSQYIDQSQVVLEYVSSSWL
jgi:predicted nuclease of predicted toxin-antitoxin system